MSKHWQQRGEAGSAFMVHFIRWLALHIGESAARLCLYPITAYFLIVRRAERRASRQYLRRVLGREPALREVARHIHTFAITILDRVFLLTGRFKPERVRMHGLPELNAHLDAGRGVLLLGSHFGSFEAVRAIGLARHELRLRILMDYQHNPQLSQLLDALNPRARDSIIDATGDSTRVLLQIHETLEAGGLVGMLADRARSGEATLQCRLLDGQIALPSGPFRIAAVLRKPVMLIFSILRSDNTYDVYFEPFIDQLDAGRRGERNQIINEWGHRYAARLDARVREAPFNWFNFYDYWSDENPHE